MIVLRGEVDQVSPGADQGSKFCRVPCRLGFKSLHHNNSCNWIPLIARNLAGWTFVCPRRNLVHPAPENNHDILIVLRYSADPLKAVSNLRLVPNPRAILKIRPPSSLDYRAWHGPQTIHSLHSYPLKSFYLRLLHCNNFTKARYAENDNALHSRY